MRVLALSLSIFLISCSSVPTKTPTTAKKITLEGFSLFDLAYLDTQQYLVINKNEVQSKGSANAALVLVNNNFKPLEINKEYIDFKYKLINILTKNGLKISKLEPTTQTLIIVELDAQAVSSPDYEEKFNKKLFNRSLTIRAIDYNLFKKNQSIKELWKTQINNFGPSSNAYAFQNVLFIFVKNFFSNFGPSEMRTIVDKADPRLTEKESKYVFSSEDLKPTTEELNLFNPKK